MSLRHRGGSSPLDDDDAPAARGNRRSPTAAAAAAAAAGGAPEEDAETASLALRLRDAEDKLAAASTSLDESMLRIRSTLARTFAARAEARRRSAQAELEAARRWVGEHMAALFAAPPAAPLWRRPLRAGTLPAQDLEDRVAAELEVAQNGRSCACCLRTCSERLYLAWGGLVFGALRWAFGIDGE